MKYSTVSNELNSQTLGPRNLSEVGLNTNPQSCRLDAISALSRIATPRNFVRTNETTTEAEWEAFVRWRTLAGSNVLFANDTKA